MEKGSSGGAGDRPASSMGVRGHKKAASQDLTESGKWPPDLRYWNCDMLLYMYLPHPAGETPELSNLKKALSSIANIHPSSSLPPGPTSPTAPVLRVQRPTVRIPHKKPPLNSAGSSENLLSGGPQSPLHRPSSRSGMRSGIRPPSRGAGLLKKKSSDLLLPGTRSGSGMRLSRSHQPSPAHR